MILPLKQIFSHSAVGSSLDEFWRETNNWLETMERMTCESPDQEFADLIDRCLRIEPSQRPSSLDLLQIARTKKRQFQKQVTLDLPLIPRHSQIPYYLLQAFVDVLDRYFRFYQVLPYKQHELWYSSLNSLRIDADREYWENSQMDSSELLAMVLKDWKRAYKLMTEQKPGLKIVCEDWWDDQGLTPFDVASRVIACENDAVDVCSDLDTVKRILDLTCEGRPDSSVSIFDSSETSENDFR